MFESANAIDLLQKAVRLVEEAPDHLSAQYLVIEEVCSVTGWSYGESWIPNHKQSRLHHSTVYYGTGLHLEEFYRKSLNYSFVYGEGLPGKVWEFAEPLWMQDVSQNSSFHRAQEAADCGLKAGYGIPVLAGDHVLGVLVFFSFEAVEEDATLLSLVAYVAKQLGGTILRKDTLLALEQERERSSRLEQIKTYFLQNMSHEMRTPMNGIMGVTQLLKDEIDDAQQRKLLGYIEDSSARLMRTLDQLLTLSELSSGGSSLSERSATALELQPLLNSLVDSYRVRAARKHLDLSCDCKEELLLINAGEKYLRDSLDFILDNAIKFTQYGQVALEAEYEEVMGRSWVRISVQDTGIGIPEEQQGLVFEDFRQISEGMGRKFEGMGLSLPLAKRMVESMGGVIELESREHEGSRFSLLFPSLIERAFSKPAGALVRSTNEPEQGVPDSDRRPRVLLVEDNLINKIVAEKTLLRSYDVDHAASGESAVNLAAARRFDIGLLDIHLGDGIDGIEVLKRLRKMPDYVDIPMIAVTGYAQEGDRERLLGHGFDAYLAKPFTREALMALVQEQLERARSFA